MSQQPPHEKAPSWPPVIDGLAYAEEPIRYSPAQQAAALARAVAEAPLPTLANKGGINLPVECLWPELPREPMTGWEVFIGLRNGRCILWLAHGDDVAEMPIPGPDATGVDLYADMRTLILRVLAEQGAV